MDLCSVNSRPQEIPISDSWTVFTLVDECELTFGLDMWDQQDAACWHACTFNLCSKTPSLMCPLSVFFVSEARRRPEISKKLICANNKFTHVDPRFDKLQMLRWAACLEVILHLRYYIVERIYGMRYRATITHSQTSSRQWLNPLKLISFYFSPQNPFMTLKHLGMWGAI